MVLIQALVSSWLDPEVVPDLPTHPQGLLSPVGLTFCCQKDLADDRDVYSPAQKDLT